jgi:hypothetical protein
MPVELPEMFELNGFDVAVIKRQIDCAGKFKAGRVVETVEGRDS